MQAFHNDQKIKDKYLERVTAHEKRRGSEDIRN